MAEQTLSEQAREAILRAIIKSAPTVGNSPAGVRELAEAYALLEAHDPAPGDAATSST